MERPLRSRHNTCVRPWVLGHRGTLLPLTIAVELMLPSTIRRVSASRTITFSVLISPGHTCRYRRFAVTLTRDNARLAETCSWLNFHDTGLSPAVFASVSLTHPHWFSRKRATTPCPVQAAQA